MFASCTDADDTLTRTKSDYKIQVRFYQERLNNWTTRNSWCRKCGIIANFNVISAHYLEFSKCNNTIRTRFCGISCAQKPLYGSTAIDFSQSIPGQRGEVFLEIPFKAGTYEYMSFVILPRLFCFNAIIPSRLSSKHKSFIGFNTYLENRIINNTSFTGNKAQGYWEFSIANNPYETSGQVENATEAAHEKRTKTPTTFTVGDGP
jgi:hypothetical protein